MRLDDWFLTPEERGNSATEIDTNPTPGVAWTEGNLVTVLVDGATYFTRLAETISSLSAGDEIRFTDWRGDGDERVSDEGTSIATLLADACRRGVDVRGLLWRSHSDLLAFSSKENRRLAREVTEAGGEVLRDRRVRRGGSHHQKMVLMRHPSSIDRDVAFIGGIDLSHGRRDDALHGGDAQVIELDPRYGSRPPWHDVQLEVRGPVVSKLDLTFQERWEDPTPLNHASRVKARLSRSPASYRRARALPTRLIEPPTSGGHAVQVLRTYPSRRPKYPFAPNGERSVARAFAKALTRARTLIYIEDQYFWSKEIARLLADALRRQPSLQVIAVVPRFPDKDSKLSGPPSRLAQSRAIDIVKRAGGERVGFYSVENDEATPIYVHAKVCVIDDVWATVGSDNLNRRSWTHDSELSCAVIDSELDDRLPLDPGGLGDGSRKFARELRLTLWAEHLARSHDDAELLNVAGAAALWRETANALTGTPTSDETTQRPAGRIRPHEIEPVAKSSKQWADVAYRLIFDPDGRPLWYRIRRRF
ncbi:MAG TPA: phospholipase D family protein [Acidimicrobiales bacterium]|jgi:phosphatidylserine/phosphatidylglycerophosphate/cardiolipin synthase-like enzyme|nr:phospholipase D family protein [Acidimicrobiales bacterium]